MLSHATTAPSHRVHRLTYPMVRNTRRLPLLCGLHPFSFTIHYNHNHRRCLPLLPNSPALKTPLGEIYNPPSSQRAASQTGYKWSFATKLGITEDQKGTSADAKALEAVRESVVNATAGAGVGDSGESSGTGSALGKSKESVRRMGPIGPSLPPGSGRDHTDSLSSLTEADRQFARETQVERQALSRATRRPVDKSEGEVYAGKEKQLENRRAKREENKVFREAREAGKGIDDDVGEDVLMGGGARDSFAAQCVGFLFLLSPPSLPHSTPPLGHVLRLRPSLFVLVNIG